MDTQNNCTNLKRRLDSEGKNHTTQVVKKPRLLSPRHHYDTSNESEVNSSDNQRQRDVNDNNINNNNKINNAVDEGLSKKQISTQETAATLSSSSGTSSSSSSCLSKKNEDDSKQIREPWYYVDAAKAVLATSLDKNSDFLSHPKGIGVLVKAENGFGEHEFLVTKKKWIERECQKKKKTKV